MIYRTFITLVMFWTMLRNRRKIEEQLVVSLSFDFIGIDFVETSKPASAVLEESCPCLVSIYFGRTYFDNAPTAILEQVLPTPPTFNALIIGYAPPIDTYATIKSMACLCSGIYNLDFSHVHPLPYPGVKVPWP